MSDESALKQAIVEATGGFVSDRFAGIIAREGRRVVRSLRDDGVRFIKASVADDHDCVLAPPAHRRPSLDWEGRGGDVLLRALEANLVNRHSRVWR